MQYASDLQMKILAYCNIVLHIICLMQILCFFFTEYLQNPEVSFLFPFVNPINKLRNANIDVCICISQLTFCRAFTRCFRTKAVIFPAPALSSLLAEDCLASLSLAADAVSSRIAPASRLLFACPAFHAAFTMVYLPYRNPRPCPYLLL